MAILSLCAGSVAGDLDRSGENVVSQIHVFQIAKERYLRVQLAELFNIILERKKGAHYSPFEISDKPIFEYG